MGTTKQLAGYLSAGKRCMILFVAFHFLISCTDQSSEEPEITVKINTFLSEENASAIICGGYISGAIIKDIEECGVCIGRELEPDINQMHTVSIEKKELFIVSFSGLENNITYYIRAYIRYNGQIIYGDSKVFSVTGNNWLVYDSEGNTYTPIAIGNQFWLKENLRVTRYLNGTQIVKITNQDLWFENESAVFCWYNNDSARYALDCGAFYNGFIIGNYKRFCPPGWHIPTDSEWETLFDYLGGAEVAGGKLKEAGFEHWIEPNTGATNESGFTALPSGGRFSSGTLGYGEIAVWWGGTKNEYGYSGVEVAFESAGAILMTGVSSFQGFPVRCIKDAD